MIRKFGLRSRITSLGVFLAFLASSVSEIRQSAGYERQGAPKAKRPDHLQGRGAWAGVGVGTCTCAVAVIWRPGWCQPPCDADSSKIFCFKSTVLAQHFVSGDCGLRPSRSAIRYWWGKKQSISAESAKKTRLCPSLVNTFYSDIL